MALICLLVVAWGTNLSATTYVVPDDRELVAKADVIATGFMVSSRARKGSRGRIETVYRVQVGDVLKGSLAASGIDVVEPGGQIDGKGVLVFGAPVFVKGHRALLFLTRTASGQWTILDLALGLFNTVVDRKGRSILVRGAGEGEEFGWGVDGRVWNEQPRLENEFVSYVRNVAQGRPARRNYETSWASTGPIRGSSIIKSAAAGSAYVYTVSFLGKNPPPPGPFRVGKFDGGQSIVFQTNGTQNGFGAESVSSASRAAAAWSSAPGVNIRYSVSGTTSSRNDQFDNNYVILFNDPDGDISGSFVGSGVVANAFVIYSSSTSVHGGETFYDLTNADVVVQDGVGASFGITAFDTAMTHEIGHTLGFRHTDQGSPTAPQGTAVMNPSLSPFGAALQPWDIDAAVAVYGGASPCAPATITGQPLGTSITSGQSTTLNVAVGGTAPLSVQWFNAGTNSAVGTPGLSLTISPTVTTSFFARATNACNAGGAQSSTVTVSVTAPVGAKRGDATGDGLITTADIFYLINNLFAGGPASIGNGDANSDGGVTTADVFFLINHLFAGGPAPVP